MVGEKERYIFGTYLRVVPSYNGTCDGTIPCALGVPVSVKKEFLLEVTWKPKGARVSSFTLQSGQNLDHKHICSKF